MFGGLLCILVGVGRRSWMWMWGAMGVLAGWEAVAPSSTKEYVTMYSEMGSKSNTMFFKESPGNAQSLVVHALASMKAMNNIMGVNVACDEQQILNEMQRKAYYL